MSVQKWSWTPPSVFHCCGQWNEDWKRHLKAAQDHLKVITHWYTWINVVFTSIKLPMLRPEGAVRAAGEATFSARCPSKCPSLRSKCMPLQDIFPSWSLWFKKIKKIQPRPKKMSINFCFRNKDEKLKCSTD